MVDDVPGLAEPLPLDSVLTQYSSTHIRTSSFHAKRRPVSIRTVRVVSESRDTIYGDVSAPVGSG